MTYYGTPTTLSAVLTAIEERVASALVLSEDYVFTGLDQEAAEQEGGPADVFAVITNPRARVSQECVAGGGQYLLAMDGTIEIHQWNRLEVDESYRDTTSLKDATLGILAQWRKLLNRDTGLQLFAPVSTGTSCILSEPMRVLDFDLKPRKVAAGWCKLVSKWELKWVEDTTTE